MRLSKENQLLSITLLDIKIILRPLQQSILLNPPLECSIRLPTHQQSLALLLASIPISAS